MSLLEFVLQCGDEDASHCPPRRHKEVSITEWVVFALCCCGDCWVNASC